uniref:Uncharacterized protein n=1 Tax=Nelumbo nucifera TaxID=4432 RepID=A0A822XN21_NELNU|nr:TPA_asm: hypothetical protein HUJ06_021608 [Nelumbo nucifera]
MEKAMEMRLSSCFSGSVFSSCFSSYNKAASEDGGSGDEVVALVIGKDDGEFYTILR